MDLQGIAGQPVELVLAADFAAASGHQMGAE